MYLIVILLIFSVNLALSEFVKNKIEVTDEKTNYEETLDLNALLVFKILNLPLNDYEDICEALCTREETKEEIKINCVVYNGNHLDASSRTNVDKSFAGKWTCTFSPKRREGDTTKWTGKKFNFTFHIKETTTAKDSIEKPMKYDLQKCRYFLHIFFEILTSKMSGNQQNQEQFSQANQNQGLENGSGNNITTLAPTASVMSSTAATSVALTNDGFNWMVVWLPIGILAVLIIIAQALCIVRIWLKAKAKTELANLRANQARAETPDNTVRYTTTPMQVKIPRESGIYEPLENFPKPKPVPPPIDTLPRPVKNESPSEQTLERSRMPTLPMSRMPPMTPKVKRDDNVSISSIDRIKNRAQFPIPTEEPIEYEVMTPTLTAPPGYFRPPVANKVKTLIPPGMPPQAVPKFNAGPSQGQVLPSMIAAAQLKPVNKSTPWNQAQRKPTLETNPFASRKNSQTGPNHVPAFNRPGPPPVMNKPPRPLPVQSIPTPDKYTESSDEEEWTYEPLPHYDDYNGSNIYDNIPR